MKAKIISVKYKTSSESAYQTLQQKIQQILDGKNIFDPYDPQLVKVFFSVDTPSRVELLSRIHGLGYLSEPLRNCPQTPDHIAVWNAVHRFGKNPELSIKILAERLIKLGIVHNDYSTIARNIFFNYELDSQFMPDYRELDTSPIFAEYGFVKGETTFTIGLRTHTDYMTPDSDIIFDIFVSNDRKLMFEPGADMGQSCYKGYLSLRFDRNGCLLAPDNASGKWLEKLDHYTRDRNMPWLPEAINTYLDQLVGRSLRTTDGNVSASIKQLQGYREYP